MRTKLICLTLFFGIMFGPTAQAQKGKDVAEGLLRALIESQLDKSRRRNKGSNLGDPFRRPAGPSVAITAEMRRLRPITVSLSRESAQLTNLVRTDARRSPSARRLLANAIRLQANAAALQQRATSINDHRVLANDFRSFNSDWTTFSHQLQQCTDISANTRTALQTVAGIDRQYCSIYGIEEQFNNRELTRRAYSLSTYVNDLVYDSQQIRRNDANHRRMIRNLGRYSESVEYFTSLVTGNSPFPTVVKEYQDSFQLWKTLEPEISRNATLSYATRRIQDANRSIHELLRLQIGVDRNHLLQMVNKIGESTTALIRGVTLEQLMLLPDASYVPAVADEFAGNVANLNDLIQRDQPAQDIGEAWVYADEAWQQMLYYLEPMRNARTASLQRSIADNMIALKQELGVSVAYDRNALVKAATALEFQTEHLATVIQQWHRRPGQHDRSLATKAKALSEGFHRLEVSLSRGQQGSVSRRDCDQMIAQWQQLRPMLRKCETDERPELDHIVARITPEIIRLRTMLE